MKKNILTMMLFAVAAIASVSCQKEAQNAPAQPVTLTFTSANPETKTEWNEENQTIWWSDKDAIRVALKIGETWYADGSGAKLYQSTSLSAKSETGKFKLKYFDAKKITESGSYNFYALYPDDAADTNFDKSTSISEVTLPSVQTSSSETFDKSADILWGKAVDPYSALPAEEVPLLWNRLVAHAHITLKGINGIVENETINSVTLTAQEGAALTGKYALNVATGEFTPAEISNTVTVNCSDIVADASGNVTFWACINPCTVTSLNIVVDTDKAVYSIDKTGLNCEFLINKRNILPVNMSTADRTPKDLTGAALPFEETFDELTGGDHNTTGSISLKHELPNFIQHGDLYEAGKAVRLAKGGATGLLVTKPLDLSSDFYVKVSAKGWNADEVGLTVKAGEQSQNINMITYGTGDFVEYVLNFKAVDNSESVTFETALGIRVFIDNIEVGTGSAVAAPVIVAQTPDKLAADATAVTIKYLVYNPVEGKTLTASTEADWLTEVQYADGTVTYNVAANTEDERNATVTLSYEGATPVEVVVTQAAKPAADAMYYVKVVENSSDLSGTYLLVCEETNEVFAGIDGNYGANQPINISSGRIESNVTNDAYQVVLTKSGESYLITFGGKYLTYKSSTYISLNESIEDNSKWNILISSTEAAITNAVSTDRHMYRSTASGGCFAVYTSKSGEYVQLYKLSSTPTLTTSTDAIPQP